MLKIKFIVMITFGNVIIHLNQMHNNILNYCESNPTLLCPSKAVTNFHHLHPQNYTVSFTGLT